MRRPEKLIRESAARRLWNAAAAPVRRLTAAASARSDSTFTGGRFDALEPRVMMSANDVVINEIMFNSATLESKDEYVELYNKGNTPVNVTGWKLSKGIDYTFGNKTLNAGAYLVVYADAARFAQKYPSVTNTVGPWVGSLSNSADTIRLSDNLGNQIDQVDYADDGDWAQHRRGGEVVKPVSGVTSTGGVATITSPGHGYANGNQVAIFGANQAEYDGVFTIANVTANTFTINVSGSPASPATGDIYVRRADNKHFGWDWFSLADGMGRSLELINPNINNNQGQDWGPSTVANGTPGAANTIVSSNIAPVITNLSQFPFIPKSTDQVTVTAKIDDEQTTGLTVQVFFRNDGAPSFGNLTMFDDGLHGDGAAGDGTYGAKLPAQPNGTVVEFYVKATDAQNNSRTWPGPTDVTGAQAANALYQVDDTTYSGSQPLFKLIMTEAERAELDTIGNISPDRDSNAAMNGTFVSVDGTGQDMRYQVGFRNRGGGSRVASVSNYRVNFGNYNSWHGQYRINLNGTWSASDIAGSALASRAGIPSQWATGVQVRVNNQNLATNGAGDGMYGSYSYVEDEDKVLVQNHFPTDDQGNYYRGVDGGHNANLSYLGTNVASYTGKYPKQTNVESNDYSDLMQLTSVLSSGSNSAGYVAGVLANVDVPEWMRFFAFNILIGNYETSLGTGTGDDFAMYRGVNDARFQLVAHDLDSILTLGDPNGVNPSPPPVNQGLFRATAVATIEALMRSPAFAPIYYAQLKDLAQNVFTPTEIGKVLRHALGGYVPAAVVDAAINQATARAAAVLAQIPRALTVTTTPAAANGYPRVSNAATLAAMTLGGKADAIRTASILVNGKAANYVPWQGAWSITNTSNQLGLNGGLNRVVVQELDANAKEIGRTFVDVYYSGPAGTNVSGTMAGAIVWSPANGPYRVTGNVTINAGASLTIQPGTTIYFANNTKLTVLGTLNAVGNDPTGATNSGHIRFSHDPTTGNTATANWTGIVLTNTSQANKLSYADIEYAGVGGPDTQIANSVIDMDHDTWGRVGSGQRIIDITGTANFSLTNSIVGSLQQQENVHFVGTVSRAVFRGNIFGTTTNASPSSKNDIIDFTGGNRPGAIVQFLDNVFVGTGTTFGDGDDFLDLDGTDAHIEGNLFMNLGHSSTTDTNSAISGGADSGATSEVVSVRNYFYNVDHAFLMKEGNFVTSINDTFDHVITAPFNFSEPGFAPIQGLGAYADGDVFYDMPVLGNGQAAMIDNPPTGSVVIRHSIMPGTVAYGGTGNIAANAQLINPAGPGIANVNVEIGLLGIAAALDASIASHLASLTDSQDLGLKPSSPARGTGPNGIDMGAEVPAGATISGEPVGTTPFNNATINVGGPGILGYQWKLDNGAWSATVNVTSPLSANAVVPPIVLSNLSNGTHRVSVQALNSASVFQGTANATISKVWTVNTALAGHVRINEVLADNQAVLNNGGTFPDAIELYNDGKGTIDLSDYSISDSADPLKSRKFVFPAGTTLAQGAYLVLYADNPSAAPGIHLGFSLNNSGGGVYVYNKLSAGGGIVDSIAYGQQLTDRSVGRVGDGSTWALTIPTLGAANASALPTGDPTRLKINEWLTDGVAPFSADFIELYNPDPLPVQIGGMYVTDKQTGWPTQNQIPALSFIPASGFLKLVADGDISAGANHVNFQLAQDRGEIALYDASQTLVDTLFYNQQSTGVSEGLLPDGSNTYAFFNQPTPGVTNGGNVVQSVTVNLSKSDDVWKYDQSDQFFDKSWTTGGFDDNGVNWQSGPGVIYHEDAALPWTKGTELADASHPYDAAHRTYYFRRTFNVDDPSAVTALRLSTLIDDGAIFYINGVEITDINGALVRLGMPAGAVDYNTSANRSPTDASIEGEFLLKTNLLVAGVNTIAVEVHQSGTTSTDLTFGLTLDATTTVTGTTPPPLRVTELMYNPPGSSAVAGDEYEYVELQNTGASPLNLAGYKFTAGIGFTFGNLTLAPGARTVVVADLAAFTARYGNSINVAGQYLGSLDNGGELLRLETGLNQVVQQFSYSNTWYPSTDGKDASLVINDATADPATWSLSSSWHASAAALGTPGITESPIAQGAVVVNEVQANTPSGPNDWIELKNTTGAPIDISGWYLSDSAANLMKFRVPAGTVIPANGFVTFTEVQSFGAAYNGANAFSLASTGDDVFLSSSTAAGVMDGYRDAAHFGASDVGVTLGRYTTSTGRVDFVALSKATRGAENAYPAVGPVVINEVMYHPDGTGDEWIEIRNITSSTVLLYDPANAIDTWKITDGVDFTFPMGLSLGAGQSMLIVPSTITAADFRTKYGIPASVQIVSGYTGALSNSGEHLELSKPGLPQPDYGIPNIRVDDVTYGTTNPWPGGPDGTGLALARFVAGNYGNDVANWRASTTLGGTPGVVNDVSPLTATGEFVEVSANQLRFKFSKNVQATLAVADLQLTNLTTGTPVAAGSIALSYDATSNIATFTFPGLASGRLAQGHYRAVLLSSGISAGGVALDGNGDGTTGDNYSFDFVHLPGDMNGDAKVDFIDFQKFELTYGKASGATWADGDFNHDGAVNDADFKILNLNMNVALPADAPLPAESPAPAPVPVVVAKPTPTSTPKRAPATKPVVVQKPVAKPAAVVVPSPFSATRIVKKKDTAAALWA